MVPVPVIRYEMGNEGEAGGIHIHLSPRDPRQVEIRVFGPGGNDLSTLKEKAIEQLFMREDFKRASVNDVGEISSPPGAQEYYKTGFLKKINAGILRDRKFKVVIDYSHSPASHLLPDLLGELGVESVGLYSHALATRVTRTDAEVRQGLNELSRIVTTLKADMGFLMDNAAEKLFLVDETGRVLSHEEALLAVGLLSSQEKGQDILAYPVHGSSVLEQVASSRGVTVFRTPVNPRHLLEYARRPNVGFVGDAKGGFIFPQFQPAFDGMFSIARILEMLAQRGVSMGHFRDQISNQINVLHRRVPCSWAHKGQVMRLAQDSAKGQKIELVDGVKIHKAGGWVLVLPDGDEAYCHVWAEAGDEATTRQYLDEYTQKVEEWQKGSIESMGQAMEMEEEQADQVSSPERGNV